MSETDKKITLAQAKTWTSQWRDTPESNCRAFLLPLEDLQGAIDEIKNQGGNPCARVYLGIDDTNTEKLIVVGTSQESDGKGGTIYRDLLPNDDGYGTNGNSLWDFSKPCPPWCDANSALNQ